MNSEKFLNDYWKDEDINEYVRQAELEEAEQTGFNNGFNNALNEIIKTMLNKGLKLSTISEISGKSINEIKKFKKLSN